MPDTIPDTMLKDRTLEIMVTPTLTWFENTILGTFTTYVQTSSKPKMDAVVNQMSGYIDISRMPPGDGKYNDNIDITLNLNPQYLVDQNGNDMRGRFAKEGEGQLPGEGAAWFCKNAVNGRKDVTPITVPDMHIIRRNDKTVIIDDDTPLNGPPYTFCLGIVLPTRGNEFVLIDPVLSSKTGLGQNPPR